MSGRPRGGGGVLYVAFVTLADLLIVAKDVVYCDLCSL